MEAQPNFAKPAFCALPTVRTALAAHAFNAYFGPSVAPLENGVGCTNGRSGERGARHLIHRFAVTPNRQCRVAPRTSPSVSSRKAAFQSGVLTNSASSMR